MTMRSPLIPSFMLTAIVHYFTIITSAAYIHPSQYSSRHLPYRLYFAAVRRATGL